MSTTTPSLMLRIAACLWVVWGLVHILAGVMTISQDTPAAVSSVADAVDPALLRGSFHEAVGAVINQHGFNLLWIGSFTLVGAFFIWRQSVTAIFLTAVVGGLADVGYFLFMDLGGFVRFMPGTVMTIVSSAAIIISLSAYVLRSRARTWSTE